MGWIELCDRLVDILHSDGGQPAQSFEDSCKDSLEDCWVVVASTSNILDCMIGFGIEEEGEYVFFPFHLHVKERKWVIIDDFYLV